MGLATRPSEDQIQIALDHALSIFDDAVKKTLYFYIDQNNVDLKKSPSIDEIGKVLHNLLGLGAELIIRRMEEELSKVVKDK
jgi:hypothetical protein